MAKANRVARSKEDLKRELVEQLQLLRLSCESFDRGIDAAGKHIAVSLRILLHHHGQSRALLDQLEFRTGWYFSSIMPIRPGNLLSDSPLLLMKVTAGVGAKWYPRIQDRDFPIMMRPILFAEWWGETVMRDQDGRTFSRMGLVLNVANTDGGAHVDPDLDEAYMAVSRQNSLGWVFGPEKNVLAGRPELACMRQIAHELLYTIHKHVPEFSALSAPVIPPAQEVQSAPDAPLVGKTGVSITFRR
jgi:hypothetical protein